MDEQALGAGFVEKERERHAVLEEFGELLGLGGVHAALRLLNRRTGHRFTGVYRVDPPTLRNLHLYDRENPALPLGADSPLRETYCSLTAGGDAPYTTADSRADPRLTAHPARESVVSYCGVPLRDAAGNAFGTLCHFDFVARPIPEAEIPLLEAAARMVERALGERAG